MISHKFCKPEIWSRNFKSTVWKRFIFKNEENFLYWISNITAQLNTERPRQEIIVKLGLLYLDSFSTILLQQRQCTIVRCNQVENVCTDNIRLAPHNYMRDIEFPSRSYSISHSVTMRSILNQMKQSDLMEPLDIVSTPFVGTCSFCWLASCRLLSATAQVLVSVWSSSALFFFSSKGTCIIWEIIQTDFDIFQNIPY